MREEATYLSLKTIDWAVARDVMQPHVRDFVTPGNGDPAVLAATREGTSITVIDNQ